MYFMKNILMFRTGSWKHDGKTSRKSVSSIKNFALISPVYLCGIRKIMTEPIRKLIAELRRPTPSRLRSYMKKLSSSNYPIIPITKTMIDGTLQQTYCSYD